MRSSSNLFPVALVSADIRGDLTEDVYRLKPNNSPDDSVELAVTRLGCRGLQARRGVPVVLVHGSFSNRRFWYSAKGLGLGAHLARTGFDVWLPEMRGHGLSPRNLAYRHNGVGDYARYDFPAIAAFVAEQTGRPAHWLGHSLGGISLAAALAGGHLDASRVLSAALLGSQVSKGAWYFKLPPLAWLAKFLLTRKEAIPVLRRPGPEDEPAGIARDVLRWHGLFGRFGDGVEDWWTGLASVDVPVLALAGNDDRQCPPRDCRALLERFASAEKRFVCLGEDVAPGERFGHVDMLAGKAAHVHAWPLIEQWLCDREAGRDMPARKGETFHEPADLANM